MLSIFQALVSALALCAPRTLRTTVQHTIPRVPLLGIGGRGHNTGYAALVTTLHVSSVVLSSGSPRPFEALATQTPYRMCMGKLIASNSTNEIIYEDCIEASRLTFTVLPYDGIKSLSVYNQKTELMVYAPRLNYTYIGYYWMDLRTYLLVTYVYRPLFQENGRLFEQYAHLDRRTFSYWEADIEEAIMAGLAKKKHQRFLTIGEVKATFDEQMARILALAHMIGIVFSLVCLALQIFMRLISVNRTTTLLRSDLCEVSATPSVTEASTDVQDIPREPATPMKVESMDTPALGLMVVPADQAVTDMLPTTPESSTVGTNKAIATLPAVEATQDEREASTGDSYLEEPVAAQAPSSPAIPLGGDAPVSDSLPAVVRLPVTLPQAISFTELPQSADVSGALAASIDGTPESANTELVDQQTGPYATSDIPTPHIPLRALEVASLVRLLEMTAVPAMVKLPASDDLLPSLKAAPLGELVSTGFPSRFTPPPRLRSTSSGAYPRPSVTPSYRARRASATAHPDPTVDFYAAAKTSSKAPPTSVPTRVRSITQEHPARTHRPTTRRMRCVSSSGRLYWSYQVPRLGFEARVPTGDSDEGSTTDTALDAGETTDAAIGLDTAPDPPAQPPAPRRIQVLDSTFERPEAAERRLASQRKSQARMTIRDRFGPHAAGGVYSGRRWHGQGYRG